MSKPSIVDRVLVLYGIENRSPTTGLPIRRGPQSGQTGAVARTILSQYSGLRQFPIYNNKNPLSFESETQPLDRAKGSRDPEGFGIGILNFAINANFFVHGSGIRNLPPEWMDLFIMAGYGVTRRASKANPGAALSAPTPATDTHGDMAAGVYHYNYTLLLEANGTSVATSVAAAAFESRLHGTNVSVTLSGGSNAVNLTLPATGIKRIYRTVAGGGAGGTKYFVGQTSGTSFMDRMHDNNLADEAPVNHASIDDAVYRPLAADQKTATVVTWLDSRYYPGVGVVGNLSFEGSAGQNVQGTLDCRGAPGADEVMANPTIVSNPGIPPQLCGADLALIAAGASFPAGVIVPRFSSIRLDLGERPTRRLDGNAPCANAGLVEYRVGATPDPRLTVDIEEDEDIDWIGHFRSGTQFAFRFQVGTEPGRRVRFYNDPEFGGENSATGTPAAPTTNLARMAEAPNFGEAEQIRTRSINFALIGDGTANWLFVRHF